MTLCLDTWITETDLMGCGCSTGELNTVQVTDILRAASEWMYQMTGERYPGSCTVTERPCGCGCGCGLLTTAWANLQGYGSGSCCSGLCGCSAESALSLTYGPLLTATVSLYGVAFTSFSIVPPNLLVRTDGNQWPSCQTYEGVDGWSVTYTYGTDPPTIVELAARDIAVDLVNACTGLGECRLPANTVAVSRRGVSMTLDPETAGKSLPRVAMALSAFGRKGQSDVVIPGKRGLITSGPVGS